MHEKFKGSLAGVGVALCLLCWPGSLPAGPVATNAVAGVHFKGTSTLHDFEGHATSAPFALTIDETAPGGPRVWSAVAQLTVAAMTTDHRRRDRSMWAMFDIAAHPEVRGAITAAPVPGPSATGEVTLRLRLRGIERDVTATVSAWHETPNMIAFDLDFQVQLDDFSLTAPSVLGMIRVGNEVRVHCTVSATPDGRSKNGGDYSGLHTPD